MQTRRARCALVGAMLAWCLGGVLWAGETSPGALEHRWLYLATNLLVDKNVEAGVALLERAARAGYNGVLLADSKFMRWDILPDRYVTNVRRFREACRRLGIRCVAAVCPIGYSNDLLSRDPHLAEGLPVRDAPFVAQEGQLVPADTSLSLVNGGLEQWRGHMPAGWTFVDEPGKVSFRDDQVKFEGRSSLRMDEIGQRSAYGNGRACQTLAVLPWRYYHVSVAVKTRDFEAAGQVRINVLGKDGQVLNFYEPRVEKTQDWRRIHATFNTLENRQVNFYVGVWGGRGGSIWWDDVRIEPAGFVNVVRRQGAPLRLTSEDGKTTFVEGQDFEPLGDPKLGNDPYPGQYSVWHDVPAVRLLPQGRIRQGQKVLASYYHTAIIHSDQVMCCMAEPKVYDILRWHLAEVHKHLQPDGYFLSHDEIRVQGWDASCRNSGKTPARLLADNIRRCEELVQAEDPGKPIYVWSDMFDPYHNAGPKDKYYLVRGEGPWHGAWEGLPPDLIVMNWNSNPKVRRDSLRHFAQRGHAQMLAGYYDGPIDAIQGWLADARAAGRVVGIMYTTWRHNYQDLEAFARAAR